MNILKIYDNEGMTFDRYTVVIDIKNNELYECLALSEHPAHPQGFSQWSICSMGSHLGKEVKFSELSTELQEHIKNRLLEG